MHEHVSLQNLELQWKKNNYEPATHTAYWGVTFGEKKDFEIRFLFNNLFDIMLSFRDNRLFIQYQKVSKKGINVTKVFLKL